MRGFFNAQMGKWNQLWVPSWQRDVVITGAISAADKTITIEDIDYANSWSGSTIVGKYLFLLLPDGTKLYREIVGWPSSTQLTLNYAVGYDIAADEVSHILGSFLLPGRLEVDEMSMEYHRPNVAEVKLRCQSIHTAVASTTTTTTTTTT
jgi:hypothetical protein